MKSLLITGATGFIGSYLVDALIDNNEFEIIVLKRETSDTFRINHLLEKVVSYDIENIKLEEVFLKHEVQGIIHLATHYVKSHQSEDIENMIDANIKFPTVLLETAVKHNVDFFINTGTFFEYNTFKNQIHEEDVPLPFNLYAATKASFDSITKYYANDYGLNTITLKLAAPFGYNDNFKLIPFIIDSILNNKQIDVGKGEQEWDFIYVKDVVDAYLQAIKLCVESKKSLHEDILIGTGKVTSIKKIVTILSEISDSSLVTNENDYTGKQIFFSCVDNTKARNLLQWMPKYSVEEALKETFNLYKENKK